MAIIALDGWKALDHECLFMYLKVKKSSLEIDFMFLFQLKDLRNSIDYRGVMVGYELWKNNELKINITINVLMKYLKDKKVSSGE